MVGCLLRNHSASKLRIGGTDPCGLSQRSRRIQSCLHSRGLDFILLSQRPKRSGKLWVGCADCQALARSSPLLQLLASSWLDQLAVGSAHRSIPRSLTCRRSRRRRILERNEMRARQEKPVRLSSIVQFNRGSSTSKLDIGVFTQPGTHSGHPHLIRRMSAFGK